MQKLNNYIFCFFNKVLVVSNKLMYNRHLGDC